MNIKNITNHKNGKICITTGIVSNTKKIPIRTDPTKKIVTFDIINNTGAITVVIFPKDYKTYGKLIKNGAKLKLKGEIKQQSENPIISLISCETLNVT